MGFFDLFKARASKSKQSSSSSASAAKAAKGLGKSGAGQGALTMSLLLPRISEARKALVAKEFDNAFALYETILADAGDRADVLVTVSADLGEHGLADKIVELISPYYDAQRHGPDTGILVLEAYLRLRDGESARQVLDLLRALGRPELEERLQGFEKVIGELTEAQTKGEIPGALTPQAIAQAAKVQLVTISKPIWYYGLETLAGAILPPKSEKVRKVLFSQLAVPGLEEIGAKMRQPEEELGRLSRALPLWFSETLFFSPQYASMTAVGLIDDLQGSNHYALFGTEWTIENIKQLLESSKEDLDFLFTGSIQRTGENYELTMHLWEVKKLRERKTWTTHWTESTRDYELAKIHEAFRVFMEFNAYPAGQGLPYSIQKTGEWLNTLGASLSLFLGDKGLLAKPLLANTPRDLEQSAVFAGASAAQSLAWVTLRQRAVKLGLVTSLAQPTLSPDPVVAKALVI